ncbi:MAG: cyclodeaminase/cyclohydrolase family protein [Candidatus Izemoplasmataceae bacterium]|jgi:methenyltetrahydrofolate cyclohydrolase|uniref:cyclodeaminase/cyclohydrolase family protein n=1 Tax=Liberiplasma polymorphum TaxID=3374570 RepID=UPI003775FE68
MKLVDLSVREFVAEVDSASPAPGGGSVSAVAASMGVGLIRMVGHLTIPKKKFQKLDEAIQEKIIDAHESVKTLELKLIDLVDRDTDAFNAIMEAYRLPKDTDSEIKKRTKAVEQATLKAIEIPESIANIALEALRKIGAICTYGNKNALSDVGVSALMLYAGLEGACLNILINLSGLSDEAMKQDFTHKVDALIKEGKSLKEDVLTEVHQSLKAGI